MATEPNESIQNGERRLSRLEGVWEGASGNFATKADVLEAKAELIQDNANTKAELVQDIANTKTELVQDNANTKTELKQDNAETKDELNAKIDGVKSDIAEVKTTLRLLFIFVPVVLAVFGVVLRLLS